MGRGRGRGGGARPPRRGAQGAQGGAHQQLRDQDGKTHTRYIKAAVVEAYKKQHAHDLPVGQDLATWALKVVASGAVVREVVGMCQEKFPDKKAVFTEASVRKKYNGTRQ